MIVHEHSKWLLKTKDGSRTLGTHASKEEAEAQERAVEAHKHTDCADCGNMYHKHSDCAACGEATDAGFAGPRVPKSHNDSGMTLHLDAGITVSREGAQVLANGWLKAPARISRSGVFTYQYPDGKVLKMLRPAEEVFSKDSMKSFEMLPVTDGHPFSPLDAGNTKLFQVGQTGENLKQSGIYLDTHVMITDAKAVQQILDGEKIELSGGYFSRDEETPGTYNGEHYDAIQHNIRGNHVALCKPGGARGGSELRIKLDSKARSVVTIEVQPEAIASRKGNKLMASYKIDGVDFEVSEQAAQALKRESDKAAAALTAANQATETAKSAEAKATAKADSLVADLKAANDALAQAPAKAAAAIKARVALETTATAAGIEFKADDADEKIKVAVVEKLTGSKLTRTDTLYIDAAFDLATAKASPFKKDGDGLMVRADIVRRNEGASPADSAAARKRMIDESEKIGKRAPGAKA